MMIIEILLYIGCAGIEWARAGRRAKKMPP